MKKPCCERQIRVTYNATTGFKLNPVMVHLHGVEIPVYSIHCALAAVLTITIMPPDSSTISKTVHDHALCLASVLGKWCLIIVDGDEVYVPAMVSVICGTSSSSSKLPAILWSCGTSKSAVLRVLDQYQSKPGQFGRNADKLMQPWRVARQNMVENAIGIGFNEEELPGSQVPRSKIAAADFLRVVAKEKREDAEEILKIYEGRVNLPEVLPVETIWKFGDCAETVPIILVAQTCQSYAIPIAMKPDKIHRFIKNISKNNQILPSEVAKSEPCCQNCQWSYAGLQHKRKIKFYDSVEKLG